MVTYLFFVIPHGRVFKNHLECSHFAKHKIGHPMSVFKIVFEVLLIHQIPNSGNPWVGCRVLCPHSIPDGAFRLWQPRQTDSFLGVDSDPPCQAEQDPAGSGLYFGNHQRGRDVFTVGRSLARRMESLDSALPLSRSCSWSSAYQSEQEGKTSLRRLTGVR